MVCSVGNKGVHIFLSQKGSKAAAGVVLNSLLGSLCWMISVFQLARNGSSLLFASRFLTYRSQVQVSC